MNRSVVRSVLGDRSDDGLLSEQITYYRRRAPDYDEWWQRRGPYDRGRDDREAWEDQVGEIRQALTVFAPEGSVLELAGGTGWWTAVLAHTAESLTVVDASPEALALNRDRVSRTDVNYVVADLFSWTPSARYDVVFFSFWLSHVPSARFGDFWTLVKRCLAPNGRAFFIEGRHDPSRAPDPGTLERRGDVHVRRLSDGSRHRVVKIFYEVPQLTDDLARLGWDAQVSTSPWFIYGSARPT